MTQQTIRLALLAAVLAAGFSFCAPSSAFAQSKEGVTATDVSAQQRRARQRVTIYPRRTALGPNAVRQCRTRLEPEARPSGTVIFPRMYCWWE